MQGSTMICMIPQVSDGGLVFMRFHCSGNLGIWVGVHEGQLEGIMLSL